MNRAAALLLYAAALAGGTYSAYHPVFDSGFGRVRADTCDGMLNHYVLEHSWRVVSDPGYCGTLLSPPCFYPTPLTLAYSENLLGTAPIYWGLRLGLPDHLAYQWWMIACSGMNFAAFAAVARWLGCGPPAAALGGFLWAFGLVHVTNELHQQMLPRFWMPVAAYHAWGFATAPGRRPLNRMLACVFLQATACVYTGWFLVTGLAVFVPAAAAVAPGGWRAVWRYVAADRWGVARVAGGWGLALGVFFSPYAVAFVGHGRGYAEHAHLVPPPAAWLTGPPGSRRADTVGPCLPYVDGECRLFSGFGVVALIAAAGLHAAWVWRRPERRPGLRLVAACLATAAAWWLLTVRVGDEVSAWWLVRFFPGGGAIRCVGRVYLVVYLFGTLGAAAWLQVVADRVRAGWRRAAVVLLVAAPVAFEQTGFTSPSTPADDFYPATDRCAADLRGAAAGYVVPSVGSARHYGDVFGMWAGLRANVPVVNGYSGREPTGYPEFTQEYDEELLRGWLAGKVRGRVRVVDPAHPGEVREVWVE